MPQCVERAEIDTYTSWEIYKAVYAVLVCAYDGYESTPMIRAFGSDANPGIWAGECSGDPAVYSRFKEIFFEEFPSGKANPHDALDVVERFLKEMEGEYAFAKVAPGEGLWRPFAQTTNLLTWEVFFEEDLPELASKVFAKDELSLLANLVGKKICSVVRHGIDQVQISFDGGSCIVTNVYTTVANGKAVDDFCVLRVSEEEPPNGQGDAIELGASARKCEDVLVAYAKEVELHDGKVRYSDVHVRAVALDFGGEYLVLSRPLDIFEELDVFRAEGLSSAYLGWGGDEDPFVEDGITVQVCRSLAWCSILKWNENDELMSLFPICCEAPALVPAECPVCGSRDAHLLMHSQGPEFRLGTIWAWCDTCRSYAHALCHVPDWWENPGFLELAELCSNPDYPSRHAAEIDEWVNAQASKCLKEQ